MKVNKISLNLFITVGLMVSLNSIVKAESPEPPYSLPLDNVFKVPTGANSYVDGNVAVITKDIQTQVGSIFSTESNKLDLSQSFHSEMYVYLGDKQGNAGDGMTFVIHADGDRAVNYTGGAGGQLGVYAKVKEGRYGLTQQIKKSFAIEFDTYHNGEDMDIDISTLNYSRGHIANSFPDLRSSYKFDGNLNVKSLIHNNVYYPPANLSNGQWHLFVVNWDATNKKLDYTFDEAKKVTVDIDPASIFGTNSVYWGFTGSTGQKTQESKVAFKQIPGLVNISSNTKVTNNGVDITSIGMSGTDGTVKFEYDLKYNGGKQNLLSPVFELKLDNFLTHKSGTLKMNGEKINGYFLDGKSLKINLPQDLSVANDTFSISFEAIPNIVTDKDTNTTINYSIGAKNYEDNLEVTFPIKKTKIIKSADFENQSWLINEINRQLTPKKIDVDVYEEDLKKITSINMNSGAVYSTEHIPATINMLSELTYLQLTNCKLVGNLPTELGDLIKLKTLSISGNTFEGGIPESFGNLAEIEILTLNNNNLKGNVPMILGSLSNLKKINLHENPLIGNLPELPMNMEQITLNDTQITYNLDVVPSFLVNAKSNNYMNTFISGLKLTGNAKVTSENSQIKPFNESDSGYFNLKSIQKNTIQELYDEHIYTIKNTVDGSVYYKGKKDTEATIPFKNGISYTVILDDAEKNRNNVLIILDKDRELKFDEVPESLLLKTKLGSENQLIATEGNLKIFDNRENKNWKLSITVSELTQNSMKLHGEYSYIDKSGISNKILTNQKFILETGESDSINEIIPISNSWGIDYGLRYSASNSNHIGSYKGDIMWTLEDAP